LIHRVVYYITDAAAKRHAENVRVWSERYESKVLAEDGADARRWAVETVFFQAVIVFAALSAMKGPLALAEELNRRWDAMLPPITEWAFAAGRSGWCLLPLICLEAYLLFRLRAAGGVKAWYAEILAGLMLMLWVWFACVVCYAPLVPWGPM
jgi:hypothetical protein